MAESYTTPHSLPILGTADYVRSPTGDNIRKQINALAVASNNALTTEGARAEAAAKSDANGKFVPVWKASTAYTAGQRVIAPTGDIVAAKAAHTSGVSYTAANWDASTQDGRIASVESKNVIQDARLANLDSAAGFGDPLALSDQLVTGLMNTASTSRGLMDARFTTDATVAPIITKPLTSAALRSNYPGMWTANTAYKAGQVAVAPGGTLIRAKAAHTSGSSYMGSNWAAVGFGTPITVATNLIPNPSAGTNGTAGWSANEVSLATTTSTITGRSEKYFRATLTAATTGNFTQKVDTSPRMPVTAGVSYTLKFWGRTSGPTSTGDVGGAVYFFDAAGAVVGSGSGYSTPVKRGTDFTELAVTQAAPTGAVTAMVRIGAKTSSNWDAAEFYDFGAVWFGEANGAYFDGATANSGDITYSWTGTPYGSASTMSIKDASAAETAPQARDGHKYAFIAGVIRNDGAGSSYWQTLKESSTHRPINIDSVTTDSSKIRINYGSLGANMTISLIAVPDETLAQAGFVMGTSVTPAYTDIKMSRVLPAVADYVSYNGTTWVSANGQFTNMTFSGGKLRLEHKAIASDMTYAVAITPRGGDYEYSLSPDASPTGSLFVEIGVRDHSGAYVSTPNTNMRFYLTHGATKVVDIDPTAVDTVAYPLSNIWLLGVMGLG